MNINWQDLQYYTNKWRTTNFPNQSCVEQMLGIIEELGELCHAHLKEIQGIRGTPEQHQAAAKDAVGDLVMYLLGYATYSDFSLAEAVENSAAWADDVDWVRDEDHTAEQSLLTLARLVGRLSFAGHGEAARSWAAKRHSGRIIWELERYCHERGFDFDQAVISTAESVLKRDWIADPNAGGENYVQGPMDESSLS